jgi:hypothetical protein
LSVTQHWRNIQDDIKNLDRILLVVFVKKGWSFKLGEVPSGEEEKAFLAGGQIADIRCM